MAHLDIVDITSLALGAGYELEKHHVDNHLLIFTKGQVQINVYYTTMTVATALRHPRKGKTQLFRRHVGRKWLRKIFDNPRIHTGIGYRERKHRRV